MIRHRRSLRFRGESRNRALFCPNALRYSMLAYRLLACLPWMRASAGGSSLIPTLILPSWVRRMAKVVRLVPRCAEEPMKPLFSLVTARQRMGAAGGQRGR
ncbi:hypothetical protein CALCODRAFT_82528 [Calocera cornea HHB12733]|uniref:Uncharacterized protein n=1 Tax=Calocera cornea HHB12733 TaxID=1353952 RepID=A0A165DDB4_9BASI|nr:hypothetical protein CALCODRAFT_82528 [Calocera cornea HHB12733]